MMRKLFPIAIIGLNLIPLYGVLAWHWKVFDLIFIYWFENVIIGVFTLGRMLIRRYGHAVELIFPFLFAPFFCVHYGIFTYGHGSFVLSLFGEGVIGSRAGITESIIPIIQQQQLGIAVIALILYHTLDWIRDIRERGLGVDNAVTLMTAPYRRIIVLHLAILLGGFLLQAINEPIMGLIAFVIIKTVSDFYHWHKDEQRAEKTNGNELVELSPEKIKELDAQYPEPYVEVNGKRISFDSFAELKNSKQFRMMESIMKLVGRSKEFKMIQTYMDRRIAQERDK